MKKLTYSLVISAVAATCAVQSARATGDAIAQSTLSQFSITPANGTFSLITVDTTTSALVGGVGQTNSGSSSSLSVSTVPYGTTFGHTVILSPLNGNGVASSSTQVPLQTGYTLPGHSTATISGTFEITGGTSSVTTTFSASVLSFISLFTDSFGQLAQGSTSFAFDLDGAPILSTSQMFTIGASQSQSFQLQSLLAVPVVLNYNQQYSFDLSLDAATLVSAVPEPGTTTLLIAGLGGLFVARRFKKQSA